MALWSRDKKESIYDPYVWDSIGPQLLTGVSKDSEQAITELPTEAFYLVPWTQAQEMVSSTSVDEAAYAAGSGRQLGYHFWSRILFAGGSSLTISSHSYAGWALKDTCYEVIMDCLYSEPQVVGATL